MLCSISGQMGFAQLEAVGDRRCLLYKGHRFVRKWGRKNNTYWRCLMHARNKCCARVTTRLKDGYELILDVAEIQQTHAAEDDAF